MAGGGRSQREGRPGTGHCQGRRLTTRADAEVVAAITGRRDSIPFPCTSLAATGNRHYIHPRQPHGILLDSDSRIDEIALCDSSPLYMTGIGYDVHQFVENRPLVLGGVTIPHSHGLAGHSDADVLCHAIADAVLGAMGQPDIGHFFPPGDPACKDIQSLKILVKCRELAAEAGLKIINVDATLIAEAPKVLPHREAMRRNIGEALGIPPERVGIKATTNETMGFVGRKEGIAALAVAQVDG